MQHIISANDFRVGIGKQRKGVADFLRLASANLRWIHTDADDANAAPFEFRKTLLETPQLGVAERSPKTTIENQRNCLRSRRSAEQIAKADQISILIQ